MTQDDYESLALGFTGVARAKVDPSEPLSYRKVDLYIIPEGGGLPSQSLKDNLAAFLEDKRMINDMLEVKDPEYVTVNMEVTIFYLKTYVASTVEQAVSYALDDFFNYASTHIDFGRGIYLSDLYRLIDAIEGVDHVDIDKIYRVVVVEYKIWESDASFSEIVISSTTKEETWTVIFILLFINGRPLRKGYDWREHATQEIHNKLIEEYKTDNPSDNNGNLKRAASTLEYKETINLLDQIYEKVGTYERIICAATGSKMQTVGLFFSKIIHPDIHIEYPTPDSYFVKGMSKGVRQVHEIVIPQFSKFLTVIRQSKKLI